MAVSHACPQSRSMVRPFPDNTSPQARPQSDLGRGSGGSFPRTEFLVASPRTHWRAPDYRSLVQDPRPGLARSELQGRGQPVCVGRWLSGDHRDQAGKPTQGARGCGEKGSNRSFPGRRRVGPVSLTLPWAPPTKRPQKGWCPEQGPGQWL